MAKINVLDKHTAELIAAGEVVERPAAVVKELLENAIDAGSTTVSVLIERGGVACIEVADNGTGIEPEFIATAFLRHATSKIEREEDLAGIATLGFRGEALASIAAVAKVTLTTKTASSEHAFCYIVQGGNEAGLEPAARSSGTTMRVENIFYNTPARMKFLKKDQSEANLCQDVVTNLALSHPEIAITFERDGKTVFSTPGNSNLLATVHSIFGRDFANTLTKAENKKEYMQVSGFVSLPVSPRGSRSMQHFFVNGRYVKNKTMQAALEAAYKGYIMGGKYPACILNLTMPYAEVDVNVHPAKTEVRFANEREVFSAVYGAALNAVSSKDAAEKHLIIGKGQNTSSTQSLPVAGFTAENEQSLFNITPQTTFNGLLDSLPVFENTKTNRQGVLASSPVGLTWQAGKSYINPAVINIAVDESEGCENRRSIEKEDTSYNSPYNNAGALIDKVEPAANFESGLKTQTAVTIPPLTLLGEVFGTYIIAGCDDYICFIDKHAAHERMLYERLLAGLGARSGQVLMQPVSITLNGEEKNAVLQNFELLEEAGFLAEDFGGNAILVRTAPLGLPEEAVADAIEEIAAKLSTGKKSATTTRQEWVYASVACRAAIKAGDKTTNYEMLALAQEVLQGKIPMFCPHGRPVLLKITQKELEKNFGRIL